MERGVDADRLTPPSVVRWGAPRASLSNRPSPLALSYAHKKQGYSADDLRSLDSSTQHLDETSTKSYVLGKGIPNIWNKFIISSEDLAIVGLESSNISSKSDDDPMISLAKMLNEGEMG
jgi:hypothetical protein